MNYCEFFNTLCARIATNKVVFLICALIANIFYLFIIILERARIAALFRYYLARVQIAASCIFVIIIFFDFTRARITVIFMLVLLYFLCERLYVRVHK